MGRLWIPNLDGIRALAVLAVIVAHSGFNTIAPAALAVTVFFFLSGFLITTLLRREVEATGKIDFQTFFIKRTLRLLPPLCVALVFAAMLTHGGFVTGTVEWTPITFQLFYLSNYYTVFWAKSFGAPILQGTHVLWSLAIEEHFYLFFPGLYLYLARRFSPPRQALVLLTCCAMVALWRFYLFTVTGSGEYRIHYCTDTRVDSILYGCILGICWNPALDKPLPFKMSSWKIGAILSVCFALLTLSLFYKEPLFRASLRYTVQGIALFPIFYLVVAAAEHKFFSWLSWEPLAFVGKMSYSLYLIHSSVQEALRYSVPDSTSLQVLLLSLPISLALSAGIYWSVECPLAKLRQQLSSDVAVGMRSNIPLLMTGT